MGHRYKKQKDEEGHSYYVECKEHVSIQGRGNVLIKNTQTQVRELYKRHVAVAPEEPSTSSCCTKLMDTSQQMRDLNDKIENEIDKLKNFRDCFLQQKEAKNANLQLESKKEPRVETQKQYKELHSPHKSKGRQEGGASRQLSIEAPPKHQGKREHPSKDLSMTSSKQVKKVGDSSGDTVCSKPFFCTLRQMSPKLNTSKDSHKSNKQLVKFQGLQRDSDRIGGGCNYVYNDGSFSPCSTYQSDYQQSLASPASSYPYYCQMGNGFDYTTVGYCPYSSDTPNHCAMGAICNCPPTLASYNCGSPSSYSRRTTDLQCDEYLRNLTSSPREPLPPKNTPTKRTKRARKPPAYPSKVAQKSGQIQEEKQSEDKTESSKEKNKPKVTIGKQDSEGDNEKERLHREYFDGYKLEHEKTAKKEPSSRSSLIGKQVTYTKLPTGSKLKTEPDSQREGREGHERREGRDGREAREGREGRDGREGREGPESREAREDRKPREGRGGPREDREAREGREGREDRQGRERLDGQQDNDRRKGQEGLKQMKDAFKTVAKEGIGYGTQTSVPAFRDVGLTCSFSCPPCVAEPELKKKCVGCATQASGPPVKDVGLNCSLSCRPCVENPELKKKCVGCATQVSAPVCRDIGLNCSLSQRANCNQSCQTTSQHGSQREVLTHAGVSSRTETSTRLQLSPAKSSELCIAEMIKNTRVICTPVNKKHQSAPQMTSTTAAPDNSVNTVYVRQNYKQSSPNSTNRNREDAFTSPDTTQVGSLCDFPQRNFGNNSYRSDDDEPSTHFTLPLNSCDTSMYSNPTSPGTQWQYCNTPTESSREDTKTSNMEQSFKERLNTIPSNSIVCEKRTRCVKFKDESAICERVDTLKCSRNFIDWERLCDDSKEDLTCLEELNQLCDNMNADESYVNETYRSSSTAEMTCVESITEEEDYLTCTESRTEHTMPCFSGCGCMRERYHMMMLKALTKPLGQ